MSKGLMALVAINLLGVLGGVTLVFMSLSSPLVEAPTKDAKDMSVTEYLQHMQIFSDKPIIYSFETLTVNLLDVEEDHVLQLEINLELADEKSYEEVASKTALVRDAIVNILAKKKYNDLHSVQGKLYLKDDISMAVNEQLSKGLVKGVYFTSFFMQ